MDVEQLQWTVERGWSTPAGRLQGGANLVLVFGSGAAFERPDVIAECSARYPGAAVVGCSTAGEIVGTGVFDDSLVATAISFQHTRVQVARASIATTDESAAAGERLAAALRSEGLVHVFVLSDGLQVNGTALVAGLLSHLPDGVTVSGGLAGDGERMQRTLVSAGAPPASGVIAAIGFYGERLRVGCGSMGGWDSFGAERLITRSRGNVLYELDNQSALSLYKKYLGDHAAGLPSTGLRFPLSVRPPNDGPAVVRTILSVNEEEQSITFAGDMPEGFHARLMKANFDRLVDGASGAAQVTTQRMSGPAELALLVSCVGRRLLLRQRVEEELESVREVLGDIPMAGFYSYGELCPSGVVGCELHNQTMTITTLCEL